MNYSQVRECSIFPSYQFFQTLDVADGTPREVLTPERLADLFGISAWYQQTDQGPVYQPLEVIR
ncbi:MAG: hypothetical protein AAGF53_13600 [Pseudomonadota bacterium]